MRTLYHLWLNPFSRKVRIVLAEKGLEFEMVVEQVWERRQGFLALNPAGEVPVLVEPDDTVLSDSQAICEFLDELQPEPSLMGRGLHERRRPLPGIVQRDRRMPLRNPGGGECRAALHRRHAAAGGLFDTHEASRGVSRAAVSFQVRRLARLRRQGRCVQLRRRLQCLHGHQRAMPNGVRLQDVQRSTDHPLYHG